MEIINHECYVSLEVAKLLKDAGFDWECKCVYNEGKLCIWYEPKSNDWWKCQSDTYAAPTFDVAQRWLREVKAFHIEIIVGDHSDDWGYYLISDIHKPDNMPIINGIPKMSKFYDDFKSYEEAQEAGIKRVLEIILEKE